VKNKENEEITQNMGENCREKEKETLGAI